MSEKRPYPLSPLTMAILLALTKEDLHGYALMQEVGAQTEGLLNPGTGSLYAALQRLEDEGLVEPATGRRQPGEDGRRKYFRITATGREAAREEARRMVRVLETVREKDLIRGLPRLRDVR